MEKKRIWGEQGREPDFCAQLSLLNPGRKSNKPKVIILMYFTHKLHNGLHSCLILQGLLFKTGVEGWGRGYLWALCKSRPGAFGKCQKFFLNQWENQSQTFLCCALKGRNGCWGFGGGRRGYRCKTKPVIFAHFRPHLWVPSGVEKNCDSCYSILSSSDKDLFLTGGLGNSCS